MVKNIKSYLKRKLLRYVIADIWQGYSKYDILVTQTDIRTLREEALYLKNSLILEYLQKRVIHESLEVFPQARTPDDLIFPQAQIYVVQELLPKFIDALCADKKTLKPSARYTTKRTR